MKNGLRDDGTHRWQQVMDHGTFTRPMPLWVCIDCNRSARVDRPDSTWALGERQWEATSEPKGCNAIRTERLARARAYAEGRS